MSNAIDRTVPPPGGPAARLVIRTWDSRTLDNGMRIDICPVSDTPAVSLRLIVNAGAGSTTPAEAGLASLAGELLVEGAGGRSSLAMAEWIDRIGASYRCRTSYDDSVLGMDTLSDQLPAVLDFLASVSREPDFPPHEVARVRELRLDRIRRRSDEPAEIASERLAEAVFGAHPYGVPRSGTLASVGAIDRDALAEFWHRRAQAGGAALVICGDVEPDRAFDLVNDRFGDWPPGTPSSSGPPAPVERAVRAGETVLVERPESRQSEIRVGGVGLARGAADEIPAIVMNAILGGLFNSRINLNLQEDKGWTYGARTSMVRRRGAGPFLLRTAVDTKATAAALDEIRKEFEAMCEGPPTSDEIALAHNALTRVLPLQFETKAQLASRRAEAITYELPEDYWVTYAEAVRSVSPEQVTASARRFLDPTDLVYLAVGDVGSLADGAS